MISRAEGYDGEPATSIYIVGLGLRRDHITAQAENAIRSSKTVFYISHVPQVAALLENYCPNVVDLAPVAYTISHDRLDAYKRMVATVIEAALSAPPVTFALYGHPLVLSKPSNLILKAASHLSITVRVVPGLSSMDCILADLGLDPGEHGIQMHEATELLLYQRPLIPDMATLIWQVGHLETRLYTNRVSRPERLVRLKAYLMKFYSASQEIYSICSSVHQEGDSQVSRMPLDGLTNHAESLHGGVTLYIPPASCRPIVDKALYAQLFDVTHLYRITSEPT